MFLIALGAALSLHLLALILPLPERAVAEPPPPKPPTERMLKDWVIPPPEIPERPAAPTAPAPRQLPVPMLEAVLPEPVSEPAPVTAYEPLGESLLDAADFDPGPPPPPNPDLLEEGTPGLMPPRLIGKCSDPIYPALAVRVRLEGVVVLKAIITEQGEVSSIELQSAPRPDLGFSDAAIAAISCWQYEPGRYQGRPVAVSMSVIVEFVLD